MANVTVFVSALTRRSWEPRVSVFTSRIDLLADLREYFEEMADEENVHAVALNDASTEEEIVDAIFDNLNETVHIEETCLVLDDPA